MANNTGTLVTSPVRPQSDADEFPSAFANELQGGYHEVADLTARDAITASRREEGMACFVVAESKLYRLIGGTANENWTEVSEVGPQGPQGEIGAQGTQGVQGFQGTQGAQGSQGSQGAQGEAGAQGEQGEDGAEGSQGPQGDVGSQGPQGYQGAQGESGDNNSFIVVEGVSPNQSRTLLVSLSETEDIIIASEIV